MSDGPTRAELEAANCWEADDQVPRQPAMTTFRRATRLHQARWRETHAHPAGSQPMRPKPGDGRVRPVGSRLDLDHALATGATFVTPAALAAVRDRTAHPEPHQSIDHQRLWADLLSSPALAFNLFGDLAADTAQADRAVRHWLPDVPGRVRAVRFLHSPGRLDPAYVGSLRDLAVAMELALDDGTLGLLAFDVRYHERTKAETPRPDNLARYTEVAERSGVFAPGAVAELGRRGDLCVMWIEHLLALSTVQQAHGAWTWTRYVSIHPAGNVDVADACARYRTHLADPAAYTSLTLESLLDPEALPPTTVDVLRDRYVPR